MKTFAKIVGAAIIVSAISGCSSNSNPAISNFVISENIKSASQTYMGISDSDTIYCTLSTSVQWPEKFGDHSLKVLQDSLYSKLYGPNNADPSKGIDDAIMRFIEAPDIFEADVTLQSVDTIPTQVMRSLYVDATAKIADLNDMFVTYQVNHQSYSGGAHPNTFTEYFTYDLGMEQVLTPQNMFVPGSEKDLLEAIKQALASQLNVDVDKLDDAGIFTDQLTEIGQPYLLDDSIVFHYNQYDIAPYSMGAIEVTIWAQEIEQYLTPRLKALLLD